MSLEFLEKLTEIEGTILQLLFPPNDPKLSGAYERVGIDRNSGYSTEDVFLFMSFESRLLLVKP